jgi:hypothetical protein
VALTVAVYLPGVNPEISYDPVALVVVDLSPAATDAPTTGFPLPAFVTRPRSDVAPWVSLKSCVAVSPGRTVTVALKGE